MYDNEYGVIDNLSENKTDTAAGTGRTDNAANTTTGTAGTYSGSYAAGQQGRAYTDYVGYQGQTGSYSGGGTTPPTNNGYYSGSSSSKNSKPKKKGKAALAITIAAVLVVGLLAGGGTTYYILSNRQVNATDSAQMNVLEESDADESQSSQVELQTADNAQNTSATSDVTIGTTTDEGTPVIENEQNALTVAQIAEKCLPSVVAITNIGETEVRSMWGNFTQETESAGSGIIIGQTDTELLILTNYHVVEDNKTLSVVFSWEEDEENADDADICNAVVKDYDSSRDIAVIAINLSDLSSDTLSKIAIATVGNSDDLVLGEQVVAIGNALGYGQSVTTGIVSALDREVETSSSDGSDTNTNTYIQTDAAINPGNSGGALFNMQGELVGVNSAKIGGDTIEGMGYAIPISEILDDVQNMMNQETRTEVAEEDRGYLGVSIVDVTSDIAQTYNLPQGAYISSITSGSGAEAAGLQKEDIITGINGKDITSSSELKGYLAYYAAGDTVTLTIQRKSDGGYEEMNVDVVLGANTEVQSGDNTQAAPGNNGGQQGQQSSSDGFGFSFPFNFGG